MPSRASRLTAAIAVCIAVASSSAGCRKEEVAKPATSPLPQSAFQAGISVGRPPTRLRAGETVVVDVKVKNLGNVAWPHLGGPGAAYGVLLAYHWLGHDGSMVVNDGIRTDLPRDLAPGSEVGLKARVQAPPQPGEYVLEFDMVQEVVDWFKARGSTTARFKVTVE